MDSSGAALTVLTSGVTSGLVTFVLNTKQQERALRRAKLEELCGILQRRAINFEQYRGLVRLHMKKMDLDSEQTPELAAATGQLRADEDKARPLIAIYYPALEQHWNRAMASHELIPDALAIRDGKSDDKDVQQETKIRLDDALVEVATAWRDLATAALEQAPSANTSLWRFWK